MIKNNKLNSQEKKWLEKMLSLNFNKKNEIINQINQADILREYTDYYLSVKFIGSFAEIKNCSKSIGILIEMRVYLENEVPIQFLLHISKGAITELEIFKADSSKICADINLDNAEIQILIDSGWK